MEHLWRLSRQQPVLFARLLDLAFLEFHMLARDRIVFLDDEFFRHGARVLLRDVEEASSCRAQQFDLVCGWLCHRNEFLDLDVLVQTIPRLDLSGILGVHDPHPPTMSEDFYDVST